MDVYLVGGAVRDALLGLPVNDRDWVVVGSTPDQMVALGYLPVGRDFPVFLHPSTHEEYALARTERKTGPGYRGFSIHAAPEVTLLEDLARRDISINAMAYAASSAEFLGQDKSPTRLTLDPQRLIDPFGGQADLQAKLLRHVTPAFREDPVRILRVARFAARFADFSVAEETMLLMRSMVNSGETRALVAERVWQELQSGLMAAKPSRMLAVLSSCGALADVMPPLSGRPQVTPDLGLANFHALDQAAEQNASLPVRFACLMQYFLADGNFYRRIPRESGALAKLLVKERAAIGQSAHATPEELVHLFERCDAFRKPARFIDLLRASGFLQHSDESRPLTPASANHRLLSAFDAARSIASGAALPADAAYVPSGPAYGEWVRAARVKAVVASLAAGINV